MVRHTVSGYFTLLRDLNLYVVFFTTLCLQVRVRVVVRCRGWGKDIVRGWVWVKHIFQFNHDGTLNEP